MLSEWTKQQLQCSFVLLPVVLKRLLKSKATFRLLIR